MTAGSVVLIALPQSDGGSPKLWPALVLSELPGPYQDVLLCGISTQLFALVPDWDERIQPGDTEFSQSGLHRASIIRISYLYSTERSEVADTIGEIAGDRLERLRSRLSRNIAP